MLKVFAIIISLPVVFLLSYAGSSPQASATPAVQGTDTWAPLRVLEGSWSAEVPGVSKVTQDYAFILNGMYLQMKTKAVFEPNEKKPKGETHEDFAVFSYDKARKKFIMRGFYVEGFVNQYVLDSISEDGKILTFITENIENAPPGTQAKLVFTFEDKDHLEQSFFVAWPKKDYACYSVHKMRRL